MGTHVDQGSADVLEGHRGMVKADPTAPAHGGSS